MPESFEYAENGGRKYLFHNRGDGTFEEVVGGARASTRAAGRWPRPRPICPAPAIPDLFLANDYGIPQLYRQSRRQAVRRGRPRRPASARTPKSGMNASFGDVFNDGRLSIYKTNISEPGVLVQANDLWVPKSKRAADAALEYEDLASSLGVDLGGWSWGAQFGDLNNDGTLDLYLMNGYVSAGERTQLLVRLRADRRRPQRHHRRREELAGDERAAASRAINASACG